MAHLMVHFEGDVRRVELDKSKLTIGRVAGNDICVDNTFVSRKHCQIEKTPKGYLLRDLKSSNGTLVDGQTIEQIKLKPGLTFAIGSARFVFQLQDSAVEQESNAQLQQFADMVAPPGSAPGNVAVASAASGGAVKAPVKKAPSDELSIAGFDVQDTYTAVLSTPDWIVSSIESLTQFGKDVGFTADDVTVINASGQAMRAGDGDDAKQKAAENAITLLRLLLYGCCRAGASDLHLEPKRDLGQLRCRIDGVMVQLLQLDADQTRKLIGVVKILCDIDITKKAVVQEGHFSLTTPDRHVDYRVSLTPSIYGQKLVIRVLDSANAPQCLRDLGLTDHMQEQLLNLTRQDAGMLLTTGPTGSGKTTTLYAALREIDASMRNLVTIEDPVEYEVEGVTQIPVNDGQGQDFNTLLRSVLRQDPDVIVVGEIRDSETATTAMRAATTGHTVMTTLHTKDSIGAIFRLLDLGVEPYLIASSLNLVMAQRLARRLCPKCKEQRRPTTNQQMRLGKGIEGVPSIFAPVGCASCFSTGYTGRVGVWEMLTVTDDLRDVILKTTTISEIRRAVENTIFTTLRDFAHQLVLRGETSFDEIDRIIGVEA